MQWETELIQIMKTELQRRQSENSRYSLRKFAKDLNLSPSGVSNLFKGRFDLSIERAKDLIPKLRLPNSLEEKLRLSMGLKVERKIVEISPEHSFLLQEWIYFAVMHFFDLDTTDKSPEAIARRLAVDIPVVQQALEKLLTEGFLKKNEDGSVYKPEIHWQGGDGGPIATEIIRAHHRENLRVAIRAIDLIPKEQRDVSTITFCGNPELMNQIREEIRCLHQKVSAMMEHSSSRAEVYRLSVALFPLTLEKPLSEK